MARNPSGNGKALWKGTTEMILNPVELKRLLHARKEYIGIRKETIIVNMFTIVASMVSALQTDNIVLKYILIVVLIILFVLNAKTFYTAVKNPYDVERLQTDIESLDTSKHVHTLVAIMDQFNDYPNKFLTYYDSVWKCYLLPNYRTKETDNHSHIVSCISRELKVPKENIKLTELQSRTYNKFSEKDKRTKCYVHTLIKADISKLSELEQSETFEIEGRKYKWMTIPQMKENAEIRKKNMDVIKMLEEI